jgi:cyclic beta-1,2-glucan synthetase
VKQDLAQLAPWNDLDPIREELFSIERIEDQARHLALAHSVTAFPGRGRPLAGRLSENAAILLESHLQVAKALEDGHAITPAAEWLLDNYYLVERQIFDVRADLPSGYYRQLPKLAVGRFTGYPRVFGLAWDMVAHTDSRFEPDILCRYVGAYQEIQPLTIGELWALAITLRLVLIENLRRLAEGIVRNRAARQSADALADRLLGAGERTPESALPLLAAYEGKPLTRSFAVQLVYRLRDQDPRVTPALTWLDERLIAQGTTTDAVVRDEHQRQGASIVTVRNIITSMRSIGDVDWTKLIERVSLVDGVLSADSGFAAMDFPTRNLYRSAIEELARGSSLDEIGVARRAIVAAQRTDVTQDPEDGARHADPGYHLLTGGRRAFERAIDYRPPSRIRLGRATHRLGVGGYGGAIVAGGMLLLILPSLLLAQNGLGGVWIGLFALLAAIPAIDLAVALVNRGVLSGFGAALVPALSLEEGIPADLRTLVAVPTLLSSVGAIREQIERLEVHHLANPGGELYFALLTDWVDAGTEGTEQDAALLEAAREGMAALNRRYEPGDGGARFLLLHRRRVWSAGEGRWMGWERKRGKLHELNRLARGATDTTFLPIDGTSPAVPADIRYVLTLDADNRVPRDAIRRLIGKMAHPLNRPRFDSGLGRVTEGYAVMQPRIAASLPVGLEGSLFQRCFSSMNGLDPYASAVSDVYQDLFGEGSYAGKGIYDIDAFEAALAGRVPESTMLSHDLFEGIFTRAALISDIEVVEEFPARYDVDIQRHHRWARGDWQLLPWILGRGPAQPGCSTPRAIPAIGRWKMIDNLRRTLSAPLLVTAMLGSWAFSLRDASICTLFLLLTIVLPTLLPLVGAVVPWRAGISYDRHFRALGADVVLALRQSFLRIAFLAHQAIVMSDAIGRTLYRLGVSRRHLLEWVTAAQTMVGPRLDLPGFYRRMAGALGVGCAGLAIAFLGGRGAWPLALAAALLWFASPAIARWASRPPRTAGPLLLSEADALALRRIARRTWRFFESFVTEADHWLPPDNFQETPQPMLAHRTSPTNIGLYLLSAVAARDFGWMGTSETIDRIEATLTTMQGLARSRGHFFNWYDTQDLRPLEPAYISSVDSGNLAGHLIALANALREWRTLPPTGSCRLDGVADSLVLAREEAEKLNDGRRAQTVTWHQFDDTLVSLSTDIERGAAERETDAALFTRLAERAETLSDIAHTLSSERGGSFCADMLFWVVATRRALESHLRDIERSLNDGETDPRLAALEDISRTLALGMEFGFLYDLDRQLLAIGYRAPEATRDDYCYDLLASEARLASFIAIAKGDVPARHWSRLGRSVTPVVHSAALISWSGSMFEYLMPSLIMRAPAGSLVEQTSQSIVKRQIAYGKELGLPWGISESAYNVRDLELTYQYSNFGVPGLGLKRGLAANLVVAPYATALAAMVDPSAALRNFEHLAGLGACGRFGFYEALDFTPARLLAGQAVAIVQTFMAHHQGMSVVAIADALLDSPARARFHAEPIIQAVDLLMQERMPRDVLLARPLAVDERAIVKNTEAEQPGTRRSTRPHGASPTTHLLSNGEYAVMLTAAGSGYSRWNGSAVTRWREDATCDDWGSYIFLRDVDGGRVWSAGYQPTCVEPDAYDVSFKEDRAEICRRDGTLTTTLELLVSPEDAAEVRRVSVLNSGSWTREIDVTSYAELVLAPQAVDAKHPAFAKMFVETEFLPDVGVLLATRRRRSPDEPELWVAHLAVVDGETVGKAEIETDRARFLGRGGSARAPLAALDGRHLSNTTGAVLDPVFAMRRRLRIAPGAVVQIAFWTMVAPTRQAVLDMADKHRDLAAFERAATLSWTQAQVQLRHLGIGPGEAALYQRLAGHLLYAAPTMRPSSDTILRGGGGREGLWVHGISGDLPIVLLRLSESDHLDLARQLLQAHDYWRMKQMAVDLVILNERSASYVQDLQIALETILRTSRSGPRIEAEAGGATGKVFLLRTDMISAESRALLLAVARVVLVGQRGRLSDQLDRAPEASGRAHQAAPVKRSAIVAERHCATKLPGSLEFFNGLGGFADDGREYVTVLGPGQFTPAPWINVVANPHFGFQVATEGGGYSWSLNSSDNQITPWSNDPVSDRPGEVLYIRDEESGELWTPTAMPIRVEGATYVAHHGRGFSRFELGVYGISADLVHSVPLDDPIKISRLRLRNESGRNRVLTVSSYTEWVLGASRSSASPFVTTEIDSVSGALFARNPYNPDFGSRVAFVDLNGRQTSWTGSRREFIGRNGTLERPAALATSLPFSGTVGAGLDPCGVLGARVEIAAGGEVEIVLFLGEERNEEAARALIARYRAADLDQVRSEVAAFWDGMLGKIQVTTPDRAMDLMLNGWLLYQTLACRFWARSAFYQASGAYGFRDQLQDGMALVALSPALTREHLLRAASRQFGEGDVQHWWLPQSGQGLRTRISDDRLWLVHAVAQFVDRVGERAILDERVAFLEGQRLGPEEKENFFRPSVSDETASLFEHCARALDCSLAVGAHGVPLIGTGDWNDGMNRVGPAGRGESVWLGWFLYDALMTFIPIAEARSEAARVAAWREHATRLKASLDREAWDGDWYLRGWFDDGTPFGTARGQECRIDSIAQSWSVLSGAAPPVRAVASMAAVERLLISDGQVLLFTPPFDKGALDPGYIKGYPPGIRENGGQYTHAALWSVMAFASLGQGDKATALFSTLNPINHARSRADVYRYKVEPYVIAADIYSVPPHVGRGGWTWYTGAAGWMQRAGVESILGLRLHGDVLHVDPCISRDWKSFAISLRHGSARYEISVENPSGVERGIAFAALDAHILSERPLMLSLVDDGQSHRLLVRLGPPEEVATSRTS